MKEKRLSDTYRFKGFVPKEQIIGVFGDSYAHVVRLERTGKKLPALHAEPLLQRSMIIRSNVSAIFPAATPGFILKSRSDEFFAGHAGK